MSRGGLMAGAILLGVPRAASGAGLTPALSAKEYGTFASLADVVRRVPGNRMLSPAADLSSRLAELTASDPEFLQSARSAVAGLDSLTVSNAFAGMDVKSRTAVLQAAVAAGVPAADPGFKTQADLLPFLEARSAVIREHAAQFPDRFGPQPNNGGALDAFFKARPPVSAPDPGYDPTRSFTFSARETQMHTFATRAIHLLGHVASGDNAHNPLFV